MMLPGCRSPWNTPQTSAPSANAAKPGGEHRFGVDAGGRHAGGVGGVEAVEAFHDQHATGDQRGVRAGHGDAGGGVGPAHGLGDVELVLGLEAEVELLASASR